MGFRRNGGTPSGEQLDDERDLTLMAHRDAYDQAHGYDSAEFIEVISSGLGASMEAKVRGDYPPKGHSYPTR
jgi:hypothetical protein